MRRLSKKPVSAESATLRALFARCAVLFILPLPLAAQSVSVYSPLSGKSCAPVKEDKESGSTLESCPGPAGFKTLVAYDDQRMSITLVTPGGGAEQPLDLWTIVTRSFSSLGKQAEWRMARADSPVALIVRVNASAEKKSYLAVAKVAAEKSCVVEVIAPAQDANRRARASADHAASKACLGGK